MRVVITYLHKGNDEYLALIDQAFASAKRHGYETVIVGNYKGHADHWIYFGVDKESRLMNWILAAQLAFIESPLFDCESVLFSPDALINKPLDKVFELDFDVAFTDRDNKKYPINNGVIFLKPAQGIREFWLLCLAKCRTYSEDIQDWYGDQLSLWDVYNSGAHERLGVKAMLLPCDTYNASPKQDVIDRRMIENAYVIHFKGKRKHMMKQYEALCK